MYRNIVFKISISKYMIYITLQLVYMTVNCTHCSSFKSFVLLYETHVLSANMNVPRLKNKENCMKSITIR